MGLLSKTKVYLCGAMQYAADGRKWREIATEELVKMGITVFDPYHKPFVDDTAEDEATRKSLGVLMAQENFDAVADRMKRVRNFDLRLCDLSDFVIAHIIPNVASWGSAEELVTNCRAKKPVFISIEGGKTCTPLWLMGMFPHKYIYNNVDEITAMIKKIDSGEKPIDSDRWKLLQPQYR